MNVSNANFYGLVMHILDEMDKSGSIEKQQQQEMMKVVWSENLQCHIDVPIEQLNRFDDAELDAAIARLPGYPDCSPSDIKSAADGGCLAAAYVIACAEAGDIVADEWYPTL